MEGLVLHENHVSDLETADEVFNRGTEVATASPDILNKGDLIGLNTKFLSQPAVVELHALVLEEDIVVRVVENLNTKHDEARVMSTCQTNVVEIIKSHAKLRTNQRVGGRVKLSSHAIGLETIDASCNEVDIVSPTGHNGVTLDGSARDSGGSK